MRELPILFSGPMVRAILEGRKTQTRRVVKVRNELPPAWATFASEGHSLSQDGAPRPVSAFFWSEEQQPGQPLKSLRRWPILPANHPMAGDWYWTPSPYGRIGDRMWVRESHAQVFKADIPSGRPTGPIGTMGTPAKPDWNSRYVYSADGPMPKFQWHHVGDSRPVRWTPSIHMPRWASRIMLEITGVRAERLQSITEADAIAEGIDRTAAGFWSTYGQSEADGTYSPRLSYRCLWDGLNAARGHGWDANPWVWVIQFRRIHGSEDR
ncbi:hypothetical protein [Burkholderia ambifaria]|uniref:hypothetical protein n=1 Tax=Burkholderia ambifaria TaxID=152480 RepID=UPI0015893040|nr:hypothetical protein [Burkholderia ambifaria]